MRSILSPLLGFLFASGTLAAVVTSDAATAAASAPQSTVTTTTDVLVTVTSTVSFGPEPTSCDLRYCETNGIMYCLYWGGFSSWDLSQHRPAPGETRTAYALCGDHTRTTAGTPTVWTSAAAAPTAAE